MPTEPTLEQEPAVEAQASEPQAAEPQQPQALPPRLAADLRQNLESAIAAMGASQGWYAVISTLLEIPAMAAAAVQKLGGPDKAQEAHRERRKSVRGLFVSYELSLIAKGLIELLRALIGKDNELAGLSMPGRVVKETIARAALNRLADRLCGHGSGEIGPQGLVATRSEATMNLSSQEFLNELEADGGPLDRSDLELMANPATLVDGVALLQLLVKRGQLSVNWQTLLESLLAFASEETMIGNNQPIDWAQCYFQQVDRDELLLFHVLDIQGILNTDPGHPRYAAARAASLQLLEQLTYPELVNDVVPHVAPVGAEA